MKLSTGAWATEPPGTPPTVAPPPPLPTPTPAPPIQCQFNDGRLVTLQPGPAARVSHAPNATHSLVAGEPIPGLPGLSLDLRLDRTTFVAGGIIEPQILVVNTTGMDLIIDGGAVAQVPGQPMVDPSQLDPRWWPNLRGRRWLGGYPLPNGESWTISSIVQVPFDASQSVTLSARVRVASRTTGPLGSSNRVTDVEVPLQLTQATPDQQLSLELHTDRHQWCLRATTASGAAPTQPLDVVLTMRGPSSYGERAPSAEAGGVYAGRWGLEGEVSMQNGVVIDRPADDPFSVSAWAGGPDYATAVIEGAVPANP